MLLRKISSTKRWDKTEIPNLISRPYPLFTGDAISDLRTHGNTISVWDTPDLSDANISPILATLALNGDKLEKIVYVTLDEEEILSKGLIVRSVLGQCDSVIDKTILERHKDICEVDYWHLGFLAEYIYERIDKGFVYTATLANIKCCVKALIDSNRVDVLRLGDKKREQMNLPPLSPCFNCELVR